MRIRQIVPLLVALTVAGGTAGIGATVSAAAAPGSGAPLFTPAGVTPLPGGFGAIQVDPVTQRVFISSPASSRVTVLDRDDAVLATLSVPGAGAMLIDGSTLYVAGTTVGRIDTFDTATLASTGSLGAGVLVKPNAVVKAGGKLWTTTGNCAESPHLASIDPATGVTTTYPANQLFYCPFLFGSPVDRNVLLGFDLGLSPATLVRMDVSSGAPVVTASLTTGASNAEDAEVMPDGHTFALAAGYPYEIRTFGIDPLAQAGVVYPTGPYPTAVEATAAAGGLLAAGRNGIYSPDVDVFRLGDPSQLLFEYDLGGTSNTVLTGGLAFSPDGSRLYAVSGSPTDGTATLNVFGPPDPGGRYMPLTPARILDTRDGTGGIVGAIGPGATVDVQVTGRGGVPETGVSAVAVNVTVTQPTTPGYLTLFPAGALRPPTSNLNFTAGKTVPNLVVVKVGVGGRVSMFNPVGATHVVFDVAGWYSDAGGPVVPGDPGRYNALVPARILDTRTGAGGGVRLNAGESLDLQVTGRGGVPATGVSAAVINVAATNTTAASFLTVHPTGEPRPWAANVNFNAGETVSNRAIAKLGVGGKVTIFNAAGSVDVVVDVSGWFGDNSSGGTGGLLTALAPARILDTRDGTGTGGFAGPLAGGGTLTVPVTGRGGVPASGVSAVILNVTVVDPAGAGFVTDFPSGSALPLASDLNYGPVETRPNLALVRVGVGGNVSIYSPTTTQIVVDIEGWIS
ncbi:MAG TPA: hypothetical protein VHT97_10340 [Acidimicrobiales bacterium]|nr:hypothetical protein [Acidimicrobiales bacterium]